MAGQDLPVTSYALLGLLTFGDDLTGYELKQRADLTLRFYWASPAMSQVYSELARLAEHRLVRAVGSEPTRYRITAAGRRRLRRWMTETPAGFPVLKHPIALRLLVGHLLEPAETIAMLEEYAADLVRQRAELQAVRGSLVGRDGPGEPFHHPALVADWGLAHYDSEAATTRRMLDRLQEDRRASPSESGTAEPT
jgi:DNA-binding PadR family transcriptional regulator